MRKIMNLIVSVILALAMVCSLTGCSKANEDIENLMTEFEYACNTLDIDAVLDCINPKVSDKIRLAVGVLGMFTETDSDEMFESLAAALAGESEVIGTEFFSSIKIEVNDIQAEKDTATVLTTLTYNLTGDDVVREATFSCIYYTEKWYISSFSIE